MQSTLRKLAAELGIQGLGIAPAIPEVTEAYPWAKSVIVAAISYLPPDRTISDDTARGWVARVARGADYHDVLRMKLSRIAAELPPTARREICVDTCPLPERKLAVLAGIAWRGWNGNAFVDGCGSYAAIGEIVTDIELSAAEPLNIDRCVTCGRCMRSCPARAIVAPYTVDTSRCLSALTQSSGIIPQELRAKMGNRIYGCDTCQEVCPQNTAAKPINPEFAEEAFPGASPELVQLIAMTSKDFEQHVRRSSIGWIRRTRIRRNAAIAAGNMKCEEAVHALIAVLRDENPVLRAHAAWALGEIATGAALDALHSAAKIERDDTVIEEIRAALSKQ